MTSSQQESIKGQTVEELSAARQRLTCLHAKAEKIRNGLVFQANAISEALGRTHDIQMRAPLGHSDWPSLSDIMVLLAEIRETTDEIERLTQRLRKWGAID